MEEQNKTEFYNLNANVEFSNEEERIYKRWNDMDAFKTQLKKTEQYPEFSFFDGPPFATGLPHYGHITAGTIKDVITRYASQTGHHVERRWGWDCHGLPIEHEVDKLFDIKTSADYERIGIKAYNEKCRSVIFTYAEQWEQIMTRTGRWIDFQNDYKTLNASFMESVWWVFNSLFKKGLIYRGCKIMPYSTGCQTVLSNFEANQNYQNVNDPSIMITLPLVEDPNVKLVAWTTTPWTLPSNLALVVHPEFTYVKFQETKSGEVYIIAECRLAACYKKAADYKILDKFPGKDLQGKQYVPLFDYFADRRADGCFQVLTDEYVTSDSGTGVVHCAPGFGEEDYKVAIKYNIIQPDNPVCPIDDYGKFTSEVKDYAGIYVKAADQDIKKELKQRGRLISAETVNHSYPFCWRTNKPLLYRAMHCWFVRVTDYKQQLLANNKKSKWVPKYVQEKRFHNWLDGCIDWCISRTRLWGNPLPLWVSDDYEEIVCVGSIKELEELSGKTGIDDIHRDKIDDIQIPSKKGKGMLKRVPEVLDCWFESGSMPYAQNHYPFSMNEEQFKKIYPCDFIAEGLDQTRGWFYTLLVLGTLLFDQCPFKNLVVNGLILAEDGSKMSKSKKNFPDPMKVINAYGADAVRLYLCNSPAVRAEPLRFKEEGVKGIIKDIFLPWINAHKFLLQNISRYEVENNNKFWFDEEKIYKVENLKNPIDRWLLATVENLVQEVRKQMESYKLYKVLPALVNFLEDLTNCYVRLNRSRMKGENVSQEESFVSLNVLFNAILKSAILMGCFVPFVTELIYENLKKCLKPDSKFQEDSIHFLQIPKPQDNAIDHKIEQNINNMRTYIDLGRKLRENVKSPTASFRYPITSCTLLHKSQEALDNLKPLMKYITEEINVINCECSTDIDKYIEYTCLPDNKVLGKRLGKSFGKVSKTLRNMPADLIEKYVKDKKITIEGVEILEGELLISRKPKTNNLKGNEVIDGQGDLYILLNTYQDENMINIGLTREFCSKIQSLRKQTRLVPQDNIVIFYKFETEGTALEKALIQQSDFLNQIIKKPVQNMNKKQDHLKLIGTTEFAVDKDKGEISIYWNHVCFNNEAMTKAFGEEIACNLQKVIFAYDATYCLNLYRFNQTFECTMDGKEYKLLPKEHFYFVE